jgi:glycosyltransferase involved in cell wall biosynthesis
LKKKIALCTTVHPRYDTRIFEKFAKSLSKKYEVLLIVSDGLGNETISNIKIIDIGKFNSRFGRFYTSFIKFNFHIFKIKAEIYQINDPELIFSGLLLKFFGKKVVYDIHESYHEEILNKHWLNSFTKFLLSKVYILIEKYSTKIFDLNITATNYIFNHVNGNKVVVNNFPKISNTDKNKFSYNKDYYLTYVGAISYSRGIMEAIQISLKSKVPLIFCGDFENQNLKNEVFKYVDNKKIIYLGMLKYQEALKLISNAIAGFVLFHPGPNHNNSLPNKLFEYMSCGTPILGTNFIKWKEIIDDNGCGFTSDFNDIEAFVKKVNFYKNNLFELQTTKNNCLKTIKKFDWLKQEATLLREYKLLIEK